MASRRTFLRDSALAMLAGVTCSMAACGKSGVSGEEEDRDTKPQPDEPFFRTRGAVLLWADVLSMAYPFDWLTLARNAGINLLNISIAPSPQTMQSDTYLKFLEDCKNFGIEVEYADHAMSQFLPRSLFDKNPEMFRMDQNGNRTKDFNCCPSSSEALRIIAENVVKRVHVQKPTSGRHFYWLDDGGQRCHCPECREFNDSDQALMIENHMLKELKKLDSKNSLAHLAYQSTMPPPTVVKPDPGIFLEFAPFHRIWSQPLASRSAKHPVVDITHGQYLDYLGQNLKIFPVGSAQVLEYWLDVSLFSNWEKPPKKLPWDRGVFLSDISTYASHGIQQITTFAVYIDKQYIDLHKDISFINEYGKGLLNYRK